MIHATVGDVVRYKYDDDGPEYQIHELDLDYDYALVIKVGVDPNELDEWGNEPGFWCSIDDLEKVE